MTLFLIRPVEAERQRMSPNNGADAGLLIDTSRIALTLARTRVMAARYPYYLLADSP